MINEGLIGQFKEIRIWQKEIPGAIINSKIKQSVDSADNWVKMKNVTDPVLDMYSAPDKLANGTAIIICPGGGYGALAILHEGSDVASWFNSLGITAFVLKYRLPNDAIMKNKSIGPMQDGQEAIRIVRRHAKEWNINPQKIGILGFSAGGHLASTLSTHFNEKVYESKDAISARPDFSILIYPVISMESKITNGWSRDNLLGTNPSKELIEYFSNELHVSKQTPPSFIVHSMDDQAVPVLNSIQYALACKKFKIPCELHIYETGGHGYGLGRSNGTESSWPDDCKKWLKAHGLL